MRVFWLLVAVATAVWATLFVVSLLTPGYWLDPAAALLGVLGSPVIGISLAKVRSERRGQ